jgi:hypothetical protein
MRSETIALQHRGILCFHCGKPVRLPDVILSKEKAIRNNEPNAAQHLLSRVFALRCRACSREGVYGIDQVVDCG